MSNLAIIIQQIMALGVLLGVCIMIYFLLTEK